ncbi:MAG: hypothetical protein M3Y45_07540 [Actinomycetota bacterium]|nr:hypothetical protein [Actinomycetota bacterium]
MKPTPRNSVRALVALLTAVATVVFFGISAVASADAAGPRCTIKGTKGPDRLVGTPKRDVICGFGGKDVLIGKGGNDVLIGGPGRDVLHGGQGRDVLRGGKGDDVIKGGPGNDRLLGEPQNDRLHGGPGNDYLDGGSGRNFYFTGPGVNRCRDTATDTVTAGCDDTAPKLVDLTVSPGSIDTTDEAKDVEFTIRLTDDLAGVKGVPSVRVVHPGSGQERHPWVERISGDAMDGVYGGKIRIEPNSAHGQWEFRINFGDRQKNITDLNGKDLAALNLPTGFRQTGAGDAVKPTIHSITLDRARINTSGSAQTVNVTMRITDDFSGVEIEYQCVVCLTAYANTPGDSTSQQHSVEDFHRVSGDALDGIYKGTLTLPRYAAQGPWTLNAAVVDRAGNMTRLLSWELEKKGFPSKIQQDGIGDTTGPELKEYTVTPRQIDTTNAPQKVQIRMRITDDLSGMPDEVPVWVVGPEWDDFWAPQTFLPGVPRISGSPTNGIYQGDVEIPQGATLGTWKTDPSLWDRAQNDSWTVNFPFDYSFTNGPLP